VVTEFWDDCQRRGCGHRPTDHPLTPEDDLPMALWDAPCSLCPCSDYDGMGHPERPSLADVVIERGANGGVLLRDGWAEEMEAELDPPRPG
jgi:hypothetical protein